MLPGLVSVTFRRKTPREILELMIRAELCAIEWGADVHVPPGDVATAGVVGEMTRQSGVIIASYGSYHRMGGVDDAFLRVLDSASALGAPVVRVWAGDRPSAAYTPAQLEDFIASARRMGDACEERGLSLALEYHGGTLTDTPDAARALFDRLRHPAILSHWQPPVGLADADCLDALHRMAPDLAHLHVFSWDVTGQRLPLSARETLWRQALSAADIAPDYMSIPRCALLEFVRGDDPDQLIADAHALRSWLRALR